MNDYYVLACGPSIKTQDLSKLKNNPCVSLSNFYVHKEFKNLNIECHVFGDLHHPITSDMGKEWFLEAETHFKPDMCVMVHANNKNLVIDNHIFKNQKVIFYNDGESTMDKFPNVIGPYLSVSQIALQFAIWKNPKNIHMMGIDHGWINHIGESRHFYDKEQSILQRLGYNEWFSMKNKQQAYETEKNNIKKLNQIYSYYAEYAHSNKICLYNSTPGSMITCLPFKEYYSE